MTPFFVFSVGYYHKLSLHVAVYDDNKETFNIWDVSKKFRQYFWIHHSVIKSSYTEYYLRSTSHIGNVKLQNS